MPERRRTVNPAKARQDAEALRRLSSGESPRSRCRLGGRWLPLLLGLLTVVLLNVSFAPWDCWFLAYVALVPWAGALVLAPTRRWALGYAWLSGLVFWGTSLYWLTWITLVGYTAGVLYLSVYWLIAAAILRAGMLRRWPMWIVLPAVWVALEYARAHVPPAFPWFLLAHTQYARTRLIQVADVTGQYGVSFFVAMVNGAGVDLVVALLMRRGQVPGLRRRLVRAAAGVVAAAVALLLYGTWQLSRETQSAGPAIGIVQRAFPISLSGRTADSEEMLESHLAGTTQFIGKGMDVVIWPETMLPRGLNAEVLDVEIMKLTGDRLRGLVARFVGPDAWRGSDDWCRTALLFLLDGGKLRDGTEVVGLRRQAAKVTNMVRRLDCPLLAGGATFHVDPDPVVREDAWVVRNGALWLDPNEESRAIYAKRHLVPFSEYVPFRRSWPGLHRLLRAFVPSAMEQLDPGEAYTRFELRRPQGTWRLVSPICYEGTFPGVCRDMIYEDGEKRADILANLSNDGWFVCHWGGGADRGSTEQAQHLSHYCFRAVENRVPVVRAVNTGISASIDSNGRIVAEIRSGPARTMVHGTLALDGVRQGDKEYLLHGPKVLVDARVSWYSRLGDLFAQAVSVMAAGLVVRLAWKRPSDKEGTRN